MAELIVKQFTVDSVQGTLSWMIFIKFQCCYPSKGCQTITYQYKPSQD